MPDANQPVLDRLHSLKIQAFQEVRSHVERIVPEAAEEDIQASAMGRFLSLVWPLISVVHERADIERKRALIASLSVGGVSDETATELVECVYEIQSK